MQFKVENLYIFCYFVVSSKLQLTKKYNAAQLRKCVQKHQNVYSHDQFSTRWIITIFLDHFSPNFILNMSSL